MKPRTKKLEIEQDKIFGIILIAVLLVISVILTAAIMIVGEYRQPEKKGEVVTVIDIKIATVTLLGNDSDTKERRNMSYIIAENNRGETIMGIIDVTGFVEGDKIVIAESRGYGYCEDDRYKWYRFVGYYPITEEYYGK